MAIELAHGLLNWHNDVAIETIGCLAVEPHATFEQISASVTLERKLCCSLHFVNSMACQVYVLH